MAPAGHTPAQSSLDPLPAPRDAFPRPMEEGRLVRFLWGFSLPFQIAGRVRRREASLWSSWRRIALTQGIVSLALGSALVGALLYGRFALMTWAEGRDDVHVEGLETTGELILVAFALYSAAEWLVIALSREHHEQLTRAMTLTFELPPEDPLRPARLGFSFRWMWRRVRRWGRGVLGLVAVAPACVVLALPLSVVGLRGRGTEILLLAWSFYWGALIACGKTAFAWRTEGDPSAPEPRLIRRLRGVPIVSLYGRFLGRMTRSSAPVAREVDAHTWEFLGLAGARVLLGIPLIYAFVRPTLPLASVLVLATRSADVGAAAR